MSADPRDLALALECTAERLGACPPPGECGWLSWAEEAADFLCQRLAHKRERPRTPPCRPCRDEMRALLDDRMPEVDPGELVRDPLVGDYAPRGWEGPEE